MSVYLTNDTDLIAVASAIREKADTSATLTFPSEWISTIQSISTGVEVNDMIFVGNYGIYFQNFDIENNVLISEKGTVSGNTLVLT